jgi:hypothetical protein
MSEPVNIDAPDFDERVWEQGWQDHRLRQLQRLAQLPLSEKLIWLEEAHRLVLHMKPEQVKTGK